MEDDIDLIQEDSEDAKTKKSNSWMPYIPRRYILAAMLFLGTANSFALRVNFNVALVAMVKDQGNDDANHTFSQCPGPEVSNNKTEKTGTFTWDPTIQSILLGAFYYGYPITQPLGGYLADRFGAKWLIASTGIIAGILNLLQPVVATWNPYALVVLRTLLGLGQGSLWPAMMAMLANWTPNSERARLLAFCNGGGAIGTIVSQSISGLLCDLNFLGGWPAAFYIFGLISLVWSLAFILMTSNTPATHPTISTEEKEFIVTNIGDAEFKNPPWKKIFTSRPFLAYWFANCMDVTAFDIIFTFLPLYMKRVLKYDISQSGGLASVPYLASFVVTFLAGYSSDVIRNKGWLSTMWIRRIYTCLGQLTQAFVVVLITLLGCDRLGVVLSFIIAVSAAGFLNGGVYINIMDIAPRYAGALLGISNGFSNLGGFIGPLIVGSLTNDSGDITSWKIVFYLVAAFFTLGNIVFCVFGSADLQPWADPKQMEATVENNLSIQNNQDTCEDEKDPYVKNKLS